MNNTKKHVQVDENSKNIIPLQHICFVIKFLRRIGYIENQFKPRIIDFYMLPFLLDEKIYHIGIDIDYAYTFSSDNHDKLQEYDMIDFIKSFKDISPKLIISEVYYVGKTIYDEYKRQEINKFSDPKFTTFIQEELFGKNGKDEDETGFLEVLENFEATKQKLTDDYIKNKIKESHSRKSSKRSPKSGVIKDTKKGSKESYQKIPAWISCPICIYINDEEYAFYKGGILESDGLPIEESYLEIVGAPFFDDSNSYSHWCLKQCPICKTYYLWEFEYEYLVNGSEDDYTLTRLSETQGKKYYKKVMTIIKKNEEYFIKKCQSYAEHLDDPDFLDERALDNIIDDISYGVLKGFDISFIIPSLLFTLAFKSHLTNKNYDKNIGKSVSFLLKYEYSNNSKEKIKILLDEMKNFIEKNDKNKISKAFFNLMKSLEDDFSELT